MGCNGGNFLEAKIKEIRLKEGDRNIIFFHKMTNYHKKMNNIKRIRIKGEWLEGKDVKSEVVNVFKDLLIDVGDWRANSKDLIFFRLDGSEAVILEVPFIEKEVHLALVDLNQDKALIVDGFTISFW